MDFWKLSNARRAVLVGILSLLLALSGVSPQALAEAVDEATTEPEQSELVEKTNDNDALVDDGADANANNKPSTNANVTGDEQTSVEPGQTTSEQTPAELGQTSNEQPTLEPTRWTIELKANGGALVEDADESSASIELLEDGDAVRLPNVYQRKTYEFVGWSTHIDPAAWQKAREEALAADPNAPEPNDKPLFVPAEASLYNLSFSYVTLEDGTLRQVSDVTAAKGADDEGRAVQTCDLRKRVRNGKLALYAQWKKVEQEEKSPSEDEPASSESSSDAAEPADAAKSSDGEEKSADEGAASNNPDENKRATSEKPAENTSSASADKAASSTETNGNAATGSSDTNATGGIDPNAELPQSAEPTPNPPTGAAALLANPQLVRDSAKGDAQATALLDAAEQNQRARKLLSSNAMGAVTARSSASALGAFALTAQSAGNVSDVRSPQYLDGTTIEDFSLLWNTSDTPSSDDHDAASLNLTPADDAALNMQARLQFALSGEKNYPAGTIQFTIPAQVIRDRDGNLIGSMTLGVPEEPDATQSFAYRLVTPAAGEGEPYYVITNTRTLDSATTGVIQFTIHDITPHVVHSGVPSPNLQAEMTLTTARGNQMVVGTNPLTATVNTHEEISNAYKNGGKVMDVNSNLVPAEIRDALENLSGDTTVNDYVLVRWNTYANVHGNQSFDFTMDDALDPSDAVIQVQGQDEQAVASSGAVILGASGSASASPGESYQKLVLDDSYLESGESRYENVWTAYPKSTFDDGKDYKLTNHVTWTVTPLDGGAATDKTAAAHISYHNPRPVAFTADPGHYTIDKETLEPHRYSTSTNTSLTDLHGIGTSANAVAPKDATINFTVTAYGEIMEQTMAVGTNLETVLADTQNPVTNPATDDRFHQRYVTMEAADDAIYLNGDYTRELGSADYYINRVHLHDPYVYTYGHEDGDENKDWGYFHNTDAAPLPTVELWGLSEAAGGTATEWTKLATMSYDNTNARTVTVAGGAAHDGNSTYVDLPKSLNITRVKMVSAAKDYDALRLQYNPSVTLKCDSSSRARQLADQLFAASDNPRATLRNDVTLVAYHGNAVENVAGHAPDVDPANAKLTADETDKVFAIPASSQSVDYARTHAMDQERYGKDLWHHTSLAYLRGAVPRIGVTSKKTLKYDRSKDLNAAAMRATLHYTATVHEQSNILTREAYDQYVTDGAIAAETSGTWYDLLPPGVEPNISSIRLRDADSVEDAYTIENYKGTGRVMLVIKANLVPQPAYNDTVEGAVAGEGYWAQGYYDEPRVSFDAVYSYADFSATEITGQDPFDELINVIAFQSGNDELGNQEGMMGEYDDATGGINTPKVYRNKETAVAVEATPDVSNMAQVMSNLDNSTTTKKPTFVYARAENRISVDRSSVSSITKQVASDAEGIFRSGTSEQSGWASHTNQVNVYEGHGYTYRIEVARGNGQTSGIVLYDALENYQLNESNTDYSIRDHRWNGTLVGVDTSHVQAMGVAPVVWYSTTIEGFDNRGAAGNNLNVGTLEDGNVINTLEKNPNGWVRADQYNGSLSAVKAVAIDCSKASNGTDDFVLPQGESLVAYIHMRAPVEVKTGSTSNLFNKIAPANDEDEPNNNAHAFNNVYINSTVSGDSQTNTHAEFYHPDYVKVGILPFKITINKVWDDANNQDGKRPDKVSVQLLANGAEAKFENNTEVPKIELGSAHAGQEGYGSDGWSYTIEDIPYVDVNNNPIHYTLHEDAITEKLDDQTIVNLYSPSYLHTDDAHMQITNKRVPETVDLVVNKTWADDDNSHGKRPSTIELSLYADGRYMDTKTVHEGADGNWSYTFTDLPAYKEGEHGQRIVYKVEEKRGESLQYYATDYEASSVGSGSTVAEDGSILGSVNITNTYSNTGMLGISKTVENVKSDAGRNADFSFKVELFGTEKDEQQNPLPLGDTYSYYVLDAEGQRVAGSEGSLRTGDTVTMKGGQRAIVEGLPIGSTYKVSEIATPGFYQSASANTTGTIAAGVTPSHAADARFTNTYRSSGSFQLKATKELQGQKLGLYAFRFQAYRVFNEGKSGNADPLQNEYEQVERSVSNAAGGDVDANGISTGDVTFARFNVTDEDLGPDGMLTLLYRIREVNAGKSGYTYATNVEQVRVTLRDKGDGTIVATQASEAVTNGTSHIKPLEDGAAMVTEGFSSNGNATFRNSYTASGTLELTAWKALKGGALEVNKFTFRLTPLTAGAPVASTMTAKNDANGVVSFPSIPLTGVHGGKSYIYKVSEDADSEASVSYSNEVYYYRVDVADDGAGNLTTTNTLVKPKADATGEAVAAGDPDAFESSDAQPIITNTLKPGNLSITKRLAQDSDYHNEEFEFKVVLTGNDIDQNSSFGYTVGNAGASSTLPVVAHAVDAFVDGLKGAWDAMAGLFAPRVAYAEGISKTDTWGSCPVTLESGVLTIGQEGSTYTLEVDSNNPYVSYPWYDWSEDEIKAIEQVRFVGTLHASKLQDLFNSDKLQSPSNNKRFVNLKTVDLGGLVAGDLENIQNMFYRCTSLESIGGTQGWTLAKCKNMKQVFYNCLSLKTIEGIETWKTPVVKDMHGMFNGCYDITALDLSGWDVSNVTDMEALFKHCESLSSVNLAGWNTNSLTKMNEMFYDCSSLTTLDVSMLNTSNVESMHGGGNNDGGVFEGCSSLQSVNVSGWDVRNVTSTKRMFYNCLALQSLDLNSWDVGSLVDMSQMFQCNENRTSQLQSVNLSGWNTANLTKMEATFQDCDSLKSIDFDGWNTPNLTSMYSAFARCGALESLDLSSFQTPSLTNLQSTFYNCSGLTSLNVGSFDVRNVSNMYNTFQGCSSLADLDLSNWVTTSALTDALGLFNGCASLERLNLSGFDLTGCPVDRLAAMFNGDNALKEVALSNKFVFSSGVEAGSQLPDPPLNALYTGKWVDNTSDAASVSAATLASTWNGASMAGTYVWELNDNVYAIRYNANGGIGAMPNQPLALDAAATQLTANAFTLPNNEFVGWNTKADGSGVSLDDEAAVTASSFTADGSAVPAKSTVNLYAQWRAAGSEATKGSYTMTVRLKKDKTATIENIPAGTSYQVFENTPAGWQLVEQSGTAGSIAPLDTKEAAFTNNYQPAVATAQLYATKTLDGASAANGAFEFTLTGQGNAPMPEGSTNNAKTVTNGNVGLVDFGSITYDEAGTYTYAIVEKPGNDDTINYDASEWTATVTVTNTGTPEDPVLATAVSYSNGADEPSSTPPAFANTTKPGELTVTKAGVNVTDANKDAEFNFTVQLQNSGQPVDSASYYIENADGMPLTSQSESAEEQGGANPLSVLGRVATGAVDSLAHFFTPRKAYAETKSGTFGKKINGVDSCTWEWDGETVTVRATTPGTVGVWEDASYTNVPWAEHVDDMQRFVAVTDSDGNATVSVRGDSVFGSMFKDRTNLVTADLRGFDMSEYGSEQNYNFIRVFYGCASLESVQLPVMDGAAVCINEIFYNCAHLKDVSIPKLKLRSGSYNSTSDLKAFCGCTDLESIDLSGIEVSKYGANLNKMFGDYDGADSRRGCTSLTTVNMGLKGAENITTVEHMFDGCTSLTDVDLSKLVYGPGARHLSSTEYMFNNCTSLKTINFNGFDTSETTTTRYMFRHCESLVALDLSDFKIPKITTIAGMFAYCYALESLDISSFNLAKSDDPDALRITSANQFIYNDTALKRIVIGSGWRNISSVSNSNFVPTIRNWVNIEDTDQTKSTVEALLASDGRDFAGTWVLAVDPMYQYVVNFKPGGAYYDTNNNAVPGSVTTLAADSITLPTPKWDTDAKTFAGWYREADFSGTKFDGGATYNRTDLLGENPTSAYVTLYAKWADNTSTTGTINVYKEPASNDGTYVLDTSREYTFTQPAGQIETITPEDIDGFITPDAKDVTVAQDATVDFYYDRVSYTVAFDANAADATGTMESMAMVGGVAKKLTPNAFEREGYGFLGWNTAPDGSGTSYTDQQQVKNLAGNNETVTLYAQWAKGSSQPSSTGTYSFKLKAGQRVHFTNVPAGTTYTVVETNAPNGWTQTDSSGTSGTIEAKQTSTASVTNTYDATGVVSLQARKTMRSGSLAEGQFSFELLDASDNNKVLQTKANLAPDAGTATAQVLFDQIDYSLSDLFENGVYAGPKTYTYKIREVVPDGDTGGVIYGADGVREQTVTVTVADAGTGKLTVTQSTTTTPVDFVNDYEPGALEVSKTTTGTTKASSGKTFTFSVKLADAQGNPVSGRTYDLVRIAGGVETADPDGAQFVNGTAAITDIHSGESFRIEGIAKDATYEVSEFGIPAGFTQTAASGETGTIGAGTKSQASFTNAYEAAGNVELKANKTLTDGNIADYTFTFQLYDETNTLLQTKKNDATGMVTFDKLGFSAADAGTRANPKKYTYKIAEVNDAQKNVAYDTHSGWLDVNVWDEGTGELTVQAVYDHASGDSSTTPETFKNKLLHPVELPATGGPGLAVPVAVVVIVATAAAARRMRRRLD